MKHFLITIAERIRESEFETKICFKLKEDENLECALLDILNNLKRCGSATKSSEWTWTGHSMAKVSNCQEISKEDFEILKKYLR